jgi:peptidyl-tRNA hydrolase
MRYTPEEAARIRRWTATTRAKVVHPKYGSVIVPSTSKLSALENAAEYWRTTWLEIRDAGVWAVEPDEGPTVRPKEFYRRRKA